MKRTLLHSWKEGSLSNSHGVQSLNIYTGMKDYRVNVLDTQLPNLRWTHPKENLLSLHQVETHQKSELWEDQSSSTSGSQSVFPDGHHLGTYRKCRFSAPPGPTGSRDLGVILGNLGVNKAYWATSLHRMVGEPL